jgi:predicted aspartyl protease
MIVGSINAYREAIIRFPVLGMQGQLQEIEAIIDTGFTGFLTLPPSIVATLGLSWRERGSATLADGSESLLDI